MTSWPEVSLREIASPVARPIAVVPGSAYRTIGVKWWGEGAYERETIDGARTAAKTLSVVREGDLIINKIWVRHGSTAIAGPSVDGCAASGEFPTFELDRRRITPRWLHWLAKTRGFWSKCDELSRGSSGKNRIKPDLFLTIRIPLPSLDEQHRIVERIEAIAGRIEEAKRLRGEVEEETEAFLPSAHSRWFDYACELGPVFPLGQLCTKITDGTHSTPRYVESGVPFLSVKDITSGTIRFDDCRFISEHEHREMTKRCKPARGDVLLTKIGTTGFAKAVDTDREFSIFVSVALLKIDRQRLLPEFTEYMLNSSRLQEHSSAGTRGVGNQNLVLKFIREFPMPAPTLAQQHKIVNSLREIRAAASLMASAQKDSVAGLEALSPAVLDRAFRGEL